MTNEAQNLLNMLEALAPYTQEELERDHKEALNEINGRAWCFVNGFNFEKWYYRPHRLWYRRSSFGFDQAVRKAKFPAVSRLTRTLDAIKSVEPEGWYILLAHRCDWKNNDKDMWFCDYARNHGEELGGVTVSSRGFKSEILARLHATIQAIQWDREND